MLVMAVNLSLLSGPVVVFVLFDLILYLPSTIFQLNRDGSFSTKLG